MLPTRTPGTAPPSVADHAKTSVGDEPYIASAAVEHIVSAAVLLQAGDHVAAVNAAHLAVNAAENPLRAILAAAALIDIDRPMRRWWDSTETGVGWRCGWCDRGVPGRPGARRYCSPGCFTASRRAYWRKRERDRRAALRAVHDDCAEAAS